MSFLSDRIVGSINNDEARNLLCKKYFDVIDDGEASLKFAFRPTLPANGLPATGLGIATSWTSDYLYYIYNFG